MTARTGTHESAQDRAAAAAFCAGRDVACPGCGYNLRDSADGVCSECGRALELRAVDDPRGRRALFWLIFAWSAVMGGGPLVVTVAQWRVYGQFPEFGLTSALLEIANAAALIYGVIGMITLLITRRPRVPLASWWARIGWIVLLSLSAQFVVAAVMMGRLFRWSLTLPF